MQRFIYIFMIFASSLAADVNVYDDRYYTVYNAEPVIRSVAPWRFGYNSNDRLHIYYKNKLPSVTAVTMSFETDNNTCLTQTIFCVLLVDLKHECEGPSNGTRKKENLKTTTPLTYLENNNYTNVGTKVSPASHGKVTTLTISSANNTEVQHTNNTFIILGSLSGIMLSLLAIIAIWRRCWIKRRPQSTHDLLTNHHFEPFYLNMIFRRECDQEIAEIEQHYYEEITPQVTEGSGHIYSNCSKMDIVK